MHNTVPASCLRGTILYLIRHARRVRAVRTAEDTVGNFYSVPDNPAGAVIAGGCHGLYGTLEAVEHMPLPVDVHFKRLVVLIAAYFARSYETSRAIAAPRLELEFGCFSRSGSCELPRKKGKCFSKFLFTRKVPL